MGKYIVELKKNETLYKAATRESDGTAYVCSAIGTPYTAPDLEQIRKEAYEEGAKSSAIVIADDKAHEAYQQGLSDAWEAARKICLGMSEGGMNVGALCDIFAVEYFRDALKDYSASEAIEKIRQYEQEKEEQDGLRQNIQTIVDQCGYTLDEIAAVLEKMRETNNG